jgi:hypothetical protein
MSSGPNPAQSPFVRGTTHPNQVFFLQPPSRRSIPDDETLKFMLAGQTVRVLSDADLAAIPLGAPLPSRKDGTLIAQHFTSPPPAITYYLMTNGQRRKSPDLATTLILTRSLTLESVELADLSAIPEGPALPSRADNTLYRGTGGAFAYILASGTKRAFPNATTLRDGGHDFSALLPLSSIDAALIPDGAPFPSTSRFLTPPSADTPLVLLPIRLETRFLGTELWLRVYPDDVHVNSFEPQLTSDEQAARTDYLSQAKAGRDAAKSAFGALARRYGPTRAAWVASSNVPTTQKTSQWSTAPFTNVLPERWIVIGYMGNAAGQVLAVGPPIQESLQVGPSPTSAGPLSDPGMKWLTDFNAAIQTGMAFRIPLTPEQQRGFNRIVVLGLKTGLNPKDSAARLGDLLQAHHYTDGLQLLPVNAPTNNTETVNAGFSATQTNYDAVFALEQGPSLCPSRPTADGDRLAAALNVAPVLLSHVNGANGRQDEIANAINTVMWPATWGYYLSQIVNGSVPNPDVMLPIARDHFATEVRARGHFPILRIGRQPYGVLPICWSAQWKPLEGRALDAPLHGLLTKMRTTWENSVANAPRIPGSADPEASLVAMLGMTPSSSSFAARNVIGPEYNFSYWNFVQKDLVKTWWTALAQKALADTADLSSVMASTRLANAVYVKQQRSLTNILIAPAPLDDLPAPNYIAQLAALGWQALRDVASPSAPIPLFFLLLRHAALRQYMDSALDLLTAAGAAHPAERIEAELLGFSTTIRPTAWDLLNRTLPGKGAVGAFLDGAKSDATVPAFSAFWRAFAQLSGFSADELDAAIREAFDLSSYRLDAWITSFAHFRLNSVRATNPNGGVVLGAYGWLENVRPQSMQAASAGFIHAPSLNQSTTAAVMRAGYMAHSDATAGRPFEVDLSSGRVRLAMHLLDGIREGQALGALLGYRLERTMHDLSLDQFIDTLRGIAPMQSASNDLDVVDGVVLLQKFQDPSFWNHPGLPATDTLQRASLTAAINRLNDTVDSAADLTLAESVHQLIRGNVVRAGATLDSIARGDAPPPNIDVINTPRSGTALGYRLMAIAPSANAAGWSATHRAQAEPRLNALAATMLGNPKLVRIRVRFLNAQNAVLSTSEIGLDQLGLAPLDLLSLPEAQGVPQELGDRIRRSVWASRPAGSVDVQIVTERDPAWKPQAVALTEWLSLAQSLARLFNASRPLLPADLVVQGDPPGTINITELQTRSDAAEAQIRATLASLGKASATDVDLLGAASFSVVGSVPNIDSAKWPAQIASAISELTARGMQLAQLAAGFSKATATPQQSFDFHSSRLKVIFGGSFQALPLLAQGPSDLFANSVSLQGNDPLESVRWFQHAARVRPGAGRLDTALMLAEALSGHLLLQFKVAQLPAVAGEKWVALKGSTSSSRLSMIGFTPGAVTAGSPVAGVMIDEWTEVLPAAQQITGVSFQYTDPVARPPQSILVAVKPDDFPEWTIDALEGSILETLDLAKIRAVDPDSLGALGHYLPALYFAFNTGAALTETVSTDFNTILKTNTGSLS